MRSDAALVRDVVALFAVSLTVRVVARLATGFDGLYGQDPFAYYAYAIQLHEALAALHLPPPFFWPIGYPFLVAAALAVLGPHPIAGQAVSAAAGAVVAPLVYLLVREVDRGARAGAWVAGLLAALGSQLLLSSLSVMSDACGLAWVTLSALAMLRYLRRLEVRWLTAAAFALGWAVLTRWVYALAVIPWAVAAAIAWWASRLRLRSVVAAAALAVAVGGAVIGVQFAADVRGSGPSHVGDLQVVSWNPANALLATVRNSDGVFHYRYPIGVFYAVPVLHPAFVFPLFAPLLLLGAVSLRSAPRPQAALLLGWPVTVYTFLAGIAWENPRFSLALLVPLLVLVGLGVQRAVESDSGRWRSAVAGACAVGLVGALAWAVRDLRRFVASKDETVVVSRWAERQLPAGATLLTFALTNTVQHYTSLQAVELYNESPGTLPAKACGPHPVYLLLDASNLAAQWAGLSPQINFRWLHDRAGLAELGHQGRYTLWRVGDRCRREGVPRPPTASGP
jgi:hypothetical protein